MSGCLVPIERGVKFTINIDRVRENDIPESAAATVNEFSGEEREIVVAAITDGVYQTDGQIPLRRGNTQEIFGSVFEIPRDYKIVRKNSEYYRVSSEQTGETQKQAYTLALENASTPSDSDDVPRDVIDYDELPKVDQDAVVLGYRFIQVREDENAAITNPRYRYIYDDDYSISRSELIPDHDDRYVRFQENVYRIDLRRQNVNLDTHRVKAEPVTEDQIVDDLLLNLNREQLSDDEEEVIGEAVEKGVYTEGYVSWWGAPNREEISDGFKSLLERFGEHIADNRSRFSDIGDEDSPPDGLDHSLTYVKYRWLYYVVGITVDSAE